MSHGPIDPNNRPGSITDIANIPPGSFYFPYRISFGKMGTSDLSNEEKQKTVCAV
jgi:hypothetical protein